MSLETQAKAVFTSAPAGHREGHSPIRSQQNILLKNLLRNLR